MINIDNSAFRVPTFFSSCKNSHFDKRNCILIHFEQNKYLLWYEGAKQATGHEKFRIRERERREQRIIFRPTEFHS